MKNKAKIFISILCIILLAIIIYKIVNTYAVFYSEVDGIIEIEKGTWRINVNGTDITKGKDISFIIDEVKVEPNEHVKEGNLAPGTKGYFELDINPTDTDVSVRYDITINKEEIKGSSIKIEFAENSLLTKTEENTYTGVILLEDIKKGKNNKIPVQVEWLDNGENEKVDTDIASKIDAIIQIPVNVHVIQYLGEEIIPYEE